MDMDIDPSPPRPESEVQLWYLQEKEGILKKKTILNLSCTDLKTVKECVVKENSSYASTIEDVDILHNGKILKCDQDVKNIRVKPTLILNVIKRRNLEGQTTPTPNPISKELITQVSVALRTAFFNPAFIPSLSKLGEGDKLEKFFAFAPGLENDPVGIAIIQDATILFHMSDVESLKKVAATRPWVVEALNYISAAIHHEKHTSSGIADPPRFNPIFEGDDEDMDEVEEEGAAGGPRLAGSPMRPITREQLAAALNSSLNSLGLGMSPSTSQGQMPQLHATLRDMMGPRGPFSANSSGGSAPNSSSSANAASAVQNFLQGAAAANSASSRTAASPAVLTSELVARAMNEALRNLPPEQRAEQFNAIRNLATQLQQGGMSQPQAQSPPVLPPRDHQPQQSNSGSSALSQAASGYQHQLAQMREVGITDERLSVVALRLSDGDVATAIELVLSGWQGEGAEPI